MPRQISGLSRRDFLLGGLAQPLAARRKPNLVFLLASQWRAQTLPVLEPQLVAPALARLLEQSVWLERAYAPDPSGAPSRASLLTGRYPHSHGVIRDGEMLAGGSASIETELKGAGYQLAFAGQWPLKEPSSITPDGWRAFLENNAGSPFALFIAWESPRPPRTPPQTFERLYQAPLLVRENVPEELSARARSEYAEYYRLCTALDEEIGRILNTLDVLNIASDTIVVFTSDEGAMLASHGLETDGLFYEECARVPAIFRYPRALPSGKKLEAPVSSVDFMPTLLALCGIEPPTGVQGHDLSRWLASGSGAHPEFVCAEGKLGGSDEWRMVVRGLDKMVVNRKFEPTWLFNLAQDPFEVRNLGSDPSLDLKRNELKAFLRLWMKQNEDRMDSSGLKRRE